MKLRSAFAGLFWLLACSSAFATCGPGNPNCVVPDRPANDSTEAAANTKFVTNSQTNFASLTTQDQTLSGGANVTSLSLSTGNVTIDCGKVPLQFITNGGAFTITAPTNDGSCILLVANNATANTISFSGFSVGSNTGDSLDTTNTHKFSIFIWRINGTAGYRVAAHQ